MSDRTTPPRGDLEFRTVPGIVRRGAERWPEAAAIEDNGVALTYAELTAHMSEAARALMALGVAPGDRVAIWAPNCWQWLVGALGAQAAGAAVVTVNTRYKGNEAAYLLNASGAKVLFTTTDFLDCDYVAALAGAGEPTPALRHIVTMRGDAAPNTAPPGTHTHTWTDFFACAASVSAAAQAAREAAVTPEDISDLIFTSGTTGRPKGVIATHAQNLRAFRTWADVVGLRAGDRYLVVLPFFHSFGYKAGCLASLMLGATILPEAVFDVVRVLTRIGPDRVSVLPGPPALYESILACNDLAAFDLSPLRLAVTGAAVIPVDLIERMRARLGFATVITGYGLTEATGVVTMCRHDDDAATIATTSGRAIDGVEVRVVAADGHALPPGEPGEVVVRGFNVTRGYFNDPAATAEVIDSDGWLHTGDVGTLDARGYIRITDRLKDMFIVGGFNAYPAEIEHELMRYDAVAECAVIGMPDARMGEVGCAFVVPKPGATIDAEALIAWCRERMANYKVPRRVVLADALPRNATGKVQKFILRDQL